jgi:large subunit ribosomal protein L4
VTTKTAPKAPVLGGSKAKEVSLEASVFAAEVKPHLVHEAVRAEMNAARSATRGGKSRGLVTGGRTKPWRQKGTGRARAGTTRAPQWTGGGMAFPPNNRNFEVKVNRKARRAALRGALSAHASEGSFAILDGSGFEAPSTKQAAELVSDLARPTVIVATEDEDVLTKSFRNLQKVLVITAAELEVATVVWARALLVTEAALPFVLAKAGAGNGAEPTAATEEEGESE